MNEEPIIYNFNEEGSYYEVSKHNNKFYLHRDGEMIDMIEVNISVDHIIYHKFKTLKESEQLLIFFWNCENYSRREYILVFTFQPKQNIVLKI